MRFCSEGLEEGSGAEGEAETGAETVTKAEMGHRGEDRGRKSRGFMGLKKGREILTEKEVAALQCGALRCGAAGMEEISWSGEGPGSQWSPLLFDIVAPRRSTTMTRGPGGEAGLAGRDEPRRDWQGQNARSPSQSQSMLSPVWIWLDLGTLTFDLSTFWSWGLRGADVEQQQEEMEVSQWIFRKRTDSCHASTAVPPKRNMGLKILVL